VEEAGLESNEAQLAALRDRQAIIDTVVRYATGVDSRDWSAYRSCFCDEIEVDFTSWSGGEPQKLSADAWVSGVRAGLEGFDATQHSSTNHRVRQDGDQATCISAMQARHSLAGQADGGLYTLGGSYTNELERTPEGWRIRRCRLTVSWSQGSREIFVAAAKQAAAKQAEA